MPFQYPQTGFHFAVAFELFPQMPADTRFQEVSGLRADVKIGTAFENEGAGAIPIPTKVEYQNLVLKRGLFIGSGIRLWCINAIEKFEFQPANLIITLLNAEHMPLMSWYVVGAYPISWEVSAFNAKESKVVIESITLQYDHFRSLSLESVASGII